MKKVIVIFFIVIIVETLACYTYAIDEKCNVHNVNMKSGMVPIEYGLLMPEYGEWKYFPNANTFASGGCFVDLSTVITRVNFCDKCREIEKEVNEDSDVLRDAEFKLSRVMTIEDLNNILAGCKNELTSEISRLIIDDYVEYIKTRWIESKL